MVTSGDFSDQRFLEEMLRESVFFANHPEVLPHVLLCTLKHVFRLYAVSPVLNDVCKPNPIL